MALPFPDTIKINLQPDMEVGPETIQVSSGLVHEPGRAHDKDRSTDIYAIDDWRVAGDLVETGEKLIEVEAGISVFTPPAEFVQTIIEGNDPRQGKAGGQPFELDRKTIEEGQEVVVTQLGDGYVMDETAVMLRSFPAKGISSGKTTNGFHFDKGDPNKLRVGVNLFDIPRMVYYVPVSRQKVMDELNQEGEPDAATYEALPGLSLPVLSVMVKPGEGWTLPTVDYLHDGRRAVPDGFSSFVLLSATRS
jgi:hypothetical protein